MQQQVPDGPLSGYRIQISGGTTPWTPTPLPKAPLRLDTAVYYEKRRAPWRHSAFTQMPLADFRTIALECLGLTCEDYEATYTLYGIAPHEEHDAPGTELLVPLDLAGTLGDAYETILAARETVDPNPAPELQPTLVGPTRFRIVKERRLIAAITPEEWEHLANTVGTDLADLIFRWLREPDEPTPAYPTPKTTPYQVPV